MSAACEGHIEVSDESFSQLRTRYGDDSIGFVAELAKKNAERKVMHGILSDAGIPDTTPEGRALCLVARLAMLAEAVRLLSK